MRIGIATITSTALVAGTLVAVPAHPLLPVTAVAQAQEQPSEAPFATAESQLIDLSLFTDSVNPADREAFLTVLEAVRAQAEYPGNENDSANLDLTLLEGIDVTVGGLNIPLLDLLNIQGPVGALGATASTPAGNQAYAATGVLTDDGSIDLSAASGGGGVETVLDLTDLLADDLLTGIIDELSLRVGAASASAERNGNEVTSEYALANVDLTLDSPLVAGVTDRLISEDPTAPGVGAQVDNLVAGLAGQEGLLNGILGALGPVLGAVGALTGGLVSFGTPEVTLDSSIQETLELLLAEPLTSSSEALTVNLATGEITINLEALGGTSAVDPNTNLLNEAAIAQISTELNTILTDLVESVRTAVLNGLLATSVTLDVDLRALVPVASISIDGTLNQLLAGEGTAEITALGFLDLDGVEGILQGLLGTVGGILKLALEDVADDVLNLLLEDVLAEVAAPLVGNLSAILGNQNILSITLNDQPNPQVLSELTRDTEGRPNAATAPIANPDEAFTVSALRINVLNGAIDLPLARATVNADANWVVAPTLDAIEDQSITLGQAIAPVTPTSTPDTAEITVDNLPAGVAYDATTGVISGTPTAAGEYEVTVRATTTGGTAQQSFTITVEDPAVAPEISPIANQTGTVGTPITPVTVEVTPDTAEVTVEGLPDGVTYNEDTGVISGTPGTAANFDVIITATNDGETATEEFTFTIIEDEPDVEAPTIGAIANQTVTLGDNITPVTLSVTPDEVAVTVSGLPNGVNYNNTTGEISGAPTSTGIFNVTVTATNDAGVATEQFTLTVIDPDEEPGAVTPTIGDIDNQNGTVGTPIDPVTVEVTPDTAEVTVEGLPAGVTYDEDTNQITGTPTEAGTSTVTVTAVNDGRTVTETFLFTVVDAIEAPSIGDIDNAEGTVDEPIDPIVVEVTPDDTDVEVIGLPDGVIYDEETGEISGIPTVPGTFTVTVNASNSAGNATETFVIVISPADGSGNGSIGGGSSDNGDASNGSSAFLQQCLDSPAAGLVGLLVALGAVSTIAGPALEPLLKSIGSAIDQQMRSLRAATAGTHQPAWVQTINRGLNDAANAVNHQMVSNAMFATAALALVSSPILCTTDGDSGSSTGSS